MRRRPHRSPVFRALALLFLLLVPASAPSRPDVIKIPFRTAGSMILVDGKVNGDPATFLLDTGAPNTVVSARMLRIAGFPMHTIQRNLEGPGLSGDSVFVRLDLQLANRRLVGQRVSIMNLDQLKNIIGIHHVDGFLGQDVLRQFRSVRIDYHAHVIELED
jgi:Aspartyl protease